MTDLLHRLRQLDAEATPGTWAYDVPEHVRDPLGKYWYIHGGHGFLDSRTGKGFSLSGWISEHDAALIVLLRNHLPQIIAALERVEGERA